MLDPLTIGLLSSTIVTTISTILVSCRKNIKKSTCWGSSIEFNTNSPKPDKPKIELPPPEEPRSSPNQMPQIYLLPSPSHITPSAIPTESQQKPPPLWKLQA